MFGSIIKEQNLANEYNKEKLNNYIAIKYLKITITIINKGYKVIK